MKRLPMFPFTFDQKLSPNDTRQSIDTRGFKALYMKKLTTKDKVVTGLAYRDGKGGVTLGLNTTEQNRHWDLVLVSPIDANCKTGEGAIKWYKKVISIKIEFDQCEENEESKLLFRQLEVIPPTTKQNTPEWCILC